MNLKSKVGLCREKNNQTSKHVGNNDARLEKAIQKHTWVLGALFFQPL